MSRSTRRITRIPWWLLAILAGGVAAAAIVLTLALPPEVSAAGRPDPGVAALQAALRARGLYDARIDGLAGPQTTKAVRVFQRRHGLVPDGVAGPRTRAALGPWARHSLGSRLLRAGAAGWDVAELQFILARCRKAALRVDGDFGPRTALVVRRQQRRAGLLVDAVAGPATIASLRRCRSTTRASATSSKRVASPAKRATGRPLVVVQRRSHRLDFYRGTKLTRVFKVATGRARTPTPLGRFTIVWKDRNPWWYPPRGPWAKEAKPIPPGPGNPLGTRWMGLSRPGIGIHGAPDAASIGYSASQGCVRMRIRDAEWLYRRVRVGTRVVVVNA